MDTFIELLKMVGAGVISNLISSRVSKWLEVAVMSTNLAL